MPFIKTFKKDFYIDNNRVVLSKDYFNSNHLSFKKITGSRFSSIFGYNKYTSPLKTWLIMTNLYKDIMDETLAYVGNTIEPKIRKYVEEQTNTKYISYNPVEIKWDMFKNNKIFGGIPDGEPVNDINELDYPNKPMLEIKTTSIDTFVYKFENNALVMQKDCNGLPLIKTKGAKRNSWFVNDKICIPIDYQMQLALYLYLRGISNGLFAIAFLEAIDYVAPEKFNIDNHEIVLADFHIDISKMKQYIEFAEQWYEDHINGAISPEISKEDIEWLKKEGINVNE